MKITYTVKMLLGVPLILKNGKIDDTIAMNFDYQSHAQNHCDELNVKVNQVATLTDILCASEGAEGVQDRNVIERTVQKLQDIDELTPVVVK
jgi:orotate phosphoribosyltransferase